MATKIQSWGRGAIEIAVESGRSDANRERDAHVHVYKNGRRTKARISIRGDEDCSELSRSELKEAIALFNDNYREICSYYQDVRDGKYDR